MCPGGISRGGADAQWKQIGSIARVDMPWSAVEWRLARQMNCTNAQHRPQKATGGRMLCLRQIIARGNVPWRRLWTGCRRSMETNRFHRARQSALECPRMPIAKSDELHERTEPATEGRRWHIGGVPANHRARQCALEASLDEVPTLNGNKPVPSREAVCPGVP